MSSTTPRSTPVHHAIRPRIASPLIGYTDHILHLRARNYSPTLGVFTSLDPFEGTRSRPMSLNGYSYVEGNVPNWTDPSGLQTTQTNEGGNGNSDYYLYRVYGYLPGDGAALNSARYPSYGVSPANSTFPFRVEGLNGIPPARPPVYIPPSYEFSLWDVLQSRFFPSIPGIGNDWAAGWDTPSTPRELSLEIEQALYINSGAACTVDSVDPRYADATWVQQQLQGTQSQNPTPQPTPTQGPSCNIDVRALPYSAVNPDQLSYATHLFIIFTNENGQEFLYRGGPTRFFLLPNPGVIRTYGGPYNDTNLDQSPNAPRISVLSGQSACSKQACLASETIRIASLQRRYNVWGPNSNSVVWTMLEKCNIPTLKPANTITPGWGMTL
jgi:RHS repeat-associated protein